MAFSAPSFGKAYISTFGVGILFGVTVTYLLKFSQQSHHYTPSALIPDSPHSHGENDNLKGPDSFINWTDKHSHSHTGEDNSVAKQLSTKVRVLCWVMTNPNNHHTKARHIKATWGQRCNKLLFMSSQRNAELPAIALNVQEGRENLWAKTKAAFKYVYEHHFNDTDWFMKLDDDTYMIVENLRYFLQDKNPNDALYYGRRFKPIVPKGYMSGGAGYVLSKEALKRFVADGLDKQKCRQDGGGAEDVEVGRCLHNVGVYAQDTRDELGRERFLPFVPEHHLIPGIFPKTMWYWSYSYYPAKQGEECCSDFAITFHYVPPNMMYVFEYFVYHLKPYGISTGHMTQKQPLQVSSEKSLIPSDYSNIEKEIKTTHPKLVDSRGKVVSETLATEEVEAVVDSREKRSGETLAAEDVIDEKDLEFLEKLLTDSKTLSKIKSSSHIKDDKDNMVEES